MNFLSVFILRYYIFATMNLLVYSFVFKLELKFYFICRSYVWLGFMAYKAF